MGKIRNILSGRKLDLRELGWLLELFSPYALPLLGLTLLRCCLTAIGIGSTLVNKQLVDWASAFLSVKGTIFLTIACSCVSLLGSTLVSLLSVHLTQHCAIRIRADLYAHVLDSLWLERTELHSGDYLSRITGDVDRICDGVISAATGLVATGVQFCLAFALLYAFDSSIALFALLSVPVIGLFSIGFGFYLKRIQVEVRKADADCRIYLQEQLSHGDVIKAFSYEDGSKQALFTLLQRQKKLTLKSSRCSIGMRVGVNAAFSAAYLFALITGALKIASGSITYGTMTAFLSLVNQVQSPVLSLSNILSQFIAVWASTGRIHEIAAMDPEDSPSPPLEVSNPVAIQAENLSFSYTPDKPILQNISFQIPPGSMVAIMGHSGIGKTTLIRLLLGFLSPQDGTLEFVSGQTHHPCAPQTRSFISYVPQGNTLFSGTIAENLRVGLPEATEAQMLQALSMACAQDFVQALPDGLQTPIGESGHGLSEGQAQRIAIARAFLRPASVLILDEATSALDEATELAILQNLKQKFAHKTCVIVSHRSTISDFADQIITL